MRKKIFFVVVCHFLYIPLCFASFVWENKTDGITERNIFSITCSLTDEDVVYVGTDRALYKTTDSGSIWRKVLSVYGNNSAVKSIFIDPDNKDIIYVVTENGLFKGRDSARSWEKVFQGMGGFEKECNSLAKIKNKLYLGTGKGLFVSVDDGKAWRKQRGPFDDKKIINIEAPLSAQGEIFLCCIDAVYKTIDDGESWDKIYSISLSQADLEIEEPEESQEETPDEPAQIKYMAIDKNNPNKIYLATSGGLFLSQDSGESWDSFTCDGLLNKDFQFLIAVDSKLYLATATGVFEFNSKRWEQLYAGLTITDIKALRVDLKNNLWLAGTGGVFKLKEKTNNLTRTDKEVILKSFEKEPTIKQVQDAAIKYAEVSPEKIKFWRRSAAAKAIMPELTLDFDKTVVTGMAGNYYRAETGPQDWAVNLKWNLADLIWSSDQASIDSRSKLMVELRNDILDQVTRLYFERKRLKVEILNSNDDDPASKIETQLRLDEITALIDSFTGGYFTKITSEST